MTERPISAVIEHETSADLIAALAASGCRIIYSGKPKGWTCLDKQAEAANPSSRYTDDYRATVLSAAYPCDSCRAAKVLQRSITGVTEP